VDGLEPGRSAVVTAGGRAVRVSTLPAPGVGPAHARVASISEIHVGERWFGRFPPCHLADDDDLAHPMVCLRAALDEIESWQPDLLVVKGDIAAENRVDEYRRVQPLLARLPFPVLVLAGNHDGGNHRGDGDVARDLAADNVTVLDRVTTVDLPSLRVVAVSSVRPGKGTGYVERSARALAAAAVGGSPWAGGALVVVHHQPMRGWLPTYWPTGIRRDRGLAFLASLRQAAGGRILVTAGHTHRHRRYELAGVPVTEVGSIKDHPGTWAGYEAWPEGIVQTVRRIAEPAAFAWNESTASMFFGVWGRWSPGRLSDRCFTQLWTVPDTASREREHEAEQRKMVGHHHQDRRQAQLPDEAVPSEDGV
jgi:3',5'-cyclic AMP phosphodiesterase CpdA